MDKIRQFFAPKLKPSQLRQPLVIEQILKKFDVFYICYDEPNREENWAQIKEILPKTKKIEGVKGFDQALKTCARKSRSYSFFVIDGDNQILPETFSQSVEIDGLSDDWVLSWASYNPLNGLSYGNGGLKLWPRHIALKMKSHENANLQDDQTDYCFIADYYLIQGYVTKTIVTKTYKQAYRAGFREGVKMSLAWGKPVKGLCYSNFEDSLGRQNRLRLKVWCEVGADVHNGLWAILGARMGLYYNTVEGFDYSLINSYQWIDRCLQNEVLKLLGLDSGQIESPDFKLSGLKEFIFEYGNRINQKFPLDLKTLSPLESLKFKEEFQNPKRQGLLRKKKGVKTLVPD